MLAAGRPPSRSLARGARRPSSPPHLLSLILPAPLLPSTRANAPRPPSLPLRGGGVARGGGQRRRWHRRRRRVQTAV